MKRRPKNHEPVPVPVLEGAICMGMSRVDGTDVLEFASPRHGQVNVYIQAENGGSLWFSYSVRDDRTGTLIQYSGPNGNFEDDDIVDGPYGLD